MTGRRLRGLGWLRAGLGAGYGVRGSLRSEGARRLGWLRAGLGAGYGVRGSLRSEGARRLGWLRAGLGAGCGRESAPAAAYAGSWQP